MASNGNLYVDLTVLDEAGGEAKSTADALRHSIFSADEDERWLKLIINTEHRDGDKTVFVTETNYGAVAVDKESIKTFRVSSSVINLFQDNLLDAMHPIYRHRVHLFNNWATAIKIRQEYKRSIIKNISWAANKAKSIIDDVNRLGTERLYDTEVKLLNNADLGHQYKEKIEMMNHRVASNYRLVASYDENVLTSKRYPFISWWLHDQAFNHLLDMTNKQDDIIANAIYLWDNPKRVFETFISQNNTVRITKLSELLWECGG